MNEHKEFQFASWLFIILIPLEIFLTYSNFNELGNRPLDKNHYLIVNATFLLIYLLFYGMRTTVDNEKITISYGVGLIWKKIAIGKIQNITIVKNPWYYGWGIRLIPNGWLYNISGTDGIELKFNDRTGITRIGTKDPSKLKSEIDKRLRK